MHSCAVTGIRCINEMERRHRTPTNEATKQQKRKVDGGKHVETWTLSLVDGCYALWDPTVHLKIACLGPLMTLCCPKQRRERVQNNWAMLDGHFYLGTVMFGHFYVGTISFGHFLKWAFLNGHDFIWAFSFGH